MSIAERALTKSRTLDARMIALTVLTVPFYVVGWVLGALWFLVSFAWSSMATGFDDGARRRSHEDR